MISLPSGEKMEVLAVCTISETAVQAINVSGNRDPLLANKVSDLLAYATAGDNVFIPYRFGYKAVYVAVKHTYAPNNERNTLFIVQTGDKPLADIHFKYGSNQRIPVLYSLRISPERSPNEDIYLYPGFIKPSSKEVSILIRHYDAQQPVRLELKNGSSGNSGSCRVEVANVLDHAQGGNGTCNLQLKANKSKRDLELTVTPEMIAPESRNAGTGFAAMGGAPMTIISKQDPDQFDHDVFIGSVRSSYAGSAANMHRYTINTLSSKIKAIKVQAYLKKSIRIEGLPVPKS